MTTVTISPLAKAKLSSAGISFETSLTTLNSGETRKKGQGVFRILNQEDGDKRVVWNSHNLGEISEAKRIFDKLVEEGLVPYKVDTSGKQTTTVMDEFDPSAEEIIFAPVAQVVGG
jgi:hypothetical protein